LVRKDAVRIEDATAAFGTYVDTGYS